MTKLAQKGLVLFDHNFLGVFLGGGRPYHSNLVKWNSSSITYHIIWSILLNAELAYFFETLWEGSLGKGTTLFTPSINNRSNQGQKMSMLNGICGDQLQKNF